MTDVARTLTILLALILGACFDSDGQADCEAGRDGCPCALSDLDGDGRVPIHGECYLGLSCAGDSICDPD